MPYKKKTRPHEPDGAWLAGSAGRKPRHRLNLGPNAILTFFVVCFGALVVCYMYEAATAAGQTFGEYLSETVQDLLK